MENLQKVNASRTLMLTVCCIVYNHEPFIRQCLEGFVMQKTNFRFEVIVHDDASTDGTAAIIHEYEEKYPEIIKPIYETENLYSKQDGSIKRIMNEHTHGKYVAFCEGDDYWIDPYKLEKQVDFLENHSDYSYVWTNAKMQKGNRLNRPYNRYPIDCDVPMEDIIMRGGLWVPTVSIVIRKDILNSMPNIKFHIGDYPMQMWAAYKGKVRYLSDVTCVYRLSSIGSWSERMSKQTAEQNFITWEKEHYLLEKMDELTGLQYHSFFIQRWHFYSYFNLLSIKKYHEAREHWVALDEKYKKCKLKSCENWCIGHGVFFMARFIVSIKSLLR